MLIAIADFADDDGRAYPSVASLARKCRMKPRNAQTILAGLRESGELVVRLGEGPRGTNLYRIPPLQELAPLQDSAPTQGLARGGAKACAIPLQGIAPKPSVNHQEPSTHTHRRRKSSIPIDFSISPRVRKWSADKGFDRLDEHLDAFKAKCQAKGYTYADWDAAFMGAIREDWAHLRPSRTSDRRAPQPENFAAVDYGTGGRL
jgi:hypothetical protein